VHESFIELTQTVQSLKVNFRHLDSDKEKRCYLRLKRLAWIFFRASSFPARFSRDVQEGWNETQIKNYKSDTEITRNRQTRLE